MIIFLEIFINVIDIFYIFFKKYLIFLNWGLGMGIGDWGLGVWGLGPSPIPHPHSPNPKPQIPNPQSPINIYVNKNKL